MSYSTGTWPPTHTELHRVRPGQVWRSKSGVLTAKVTSHCPELGQDFAYLELGFRSGSTLNARDRFIGVQVVWPHDRPIQCVVHELEEFLGRYELIEEPL